MTQRQSPSFGSLHLGLRPNLSEVTVPKTRGWFGQSDLRRLGISVRCVRLIVTGLVCRCDRVASGLQGGRPGPACGPAGR
jgi:hypothetical protein